MTIEPIHPAPFLELEQLKITIKKKTVINDVSLTISEAEHLAFLAPPHSGKSALLKTMIGLVHADHGSAHILGLDCWSESLEVRRRCGYIPAVPVYEDGLSVNDLLAFSASLGREEADWDYVEALVDRFQLNPRKRLAALSRTEIKLAAFILAFMTHPRVVLMDEPYAGLDDEGCEIINSLLDECQAEKLTLVAAISGPTQIGQVFKKVALLQQGNLVSVISADKLTTQVVRKVEITFGTKPPIEQLTRSGLVRQLSWEGTTLRGFVIGPSGAFLKTLEGCEILDIKSWEADLEDIIRVV